MSGPDEPLEPPALWDEQACNEWTNSGIPWDQLDGLVGDLTWDQWRTATLSRIAEHCDPNTLVLAPGVMWPTLTREATLSVLASEVQQTRERHRLARRLRGEAHLGESERPDTDPTGRNQV